MSSFAMDGSIGLKTNLGNAKSRERLHGVGEDALLAAAKSGNSEALEALLQPHSKNIFRALQRITRNREDAEDALQDSFMKAFMHIKKFNGKSKFSTWLTRIAINSALMIVRRKNAKHARVDPSRDSAAISLEAVPDRTPNPEAAYLRDERGALVRRAVSEMAPTLREPLIMQHFDQLSVDEIAEQMGLSTGAAKSRLLRARWQLRRSLAKSSL